MQVFTNLPFPLDQRKVIIKIQVSNSISMDIPIRWSDDNLTKSGCVMSYCWSVLG